MEPICSCSEAERDKGESRREVLMENYGWAPKKTPAVMTGVLYPFCESSKL